MKGSAHLSQEILLAPQGKREAESVAFSSAFWETEAQGKHIAPGSSPGPWFWGVPCLWQGVCRGLIHVARVLGCWVEVKAVAEPQAGWLERRVDLLTTGCWALLPLVIIWHLLYLSLVLTAIGNTGQKEVRNKSDTNIEDSLVVDRGEGVWEAVRMG